MPAPALVAETGTLATGVVTVAGAVTGYRTFAAALADGETVDVVLRDADGDQASYPNSTWDETAGTLTLGTVDVSAGTISDGAVTVWAVESVVAMLQAEAETGTATDARLISAEVLKAGVIEHAPDDAPTPRGAAWTDLTNRTLDQKRHTYTGSGADVLSVSSPADGQWAIVEIVSAGSISSSLTFLGGSDENNITAGAELLLRTDGATVWASVVEPS